MGDRASLGVGTPDGVVWFYTHQHGTDLPSRLATAFRRGRPRWNDAPYLTRILYDAVCVDGWGDVEGYAIGFRPVDTEWQRPVLFVDVATQRISAHPLDRTRSVPLKCASWDWGAFMRDEPGWPQITKVVKLRQGSDDYHADRASA